MQASGPSPKTGGERPHKRGSKFDPFRTTTAKSPHIRLPSVAPVSFFRIPEARMSPFRVAALLIMASLFRSREICNATELSNQPSRPTGLHSQVHRGKLQRHAPVL